MPSRTFPSTKSSLYAVTGSTELGGGQDPHLPVGGSWSGYTFRGAVQFSLDWSSVKRITSAVLHIKVSTQVHVGFSSAPDIYVRRCTSSWTPNSASSGVDGGSGWSTSGSVYPGPSYTTTGQASKRIPTSEATWVDIDITAIVRAWAPTSVEGGGAASNYGVILIGVASGDITEFSSYETSSSSNRPSVVVQYETDAAPTATATGPTGTTTSKRPNLTGTGSDPDGDAITSYQVEVRQGTTVVYTWTGGSGGSYSHTPTSDLPSGNLTTRVRATAAGLQGAYSADKAFTIDRIPIMGAWSAPAASVAGTRRPVHTIAWSDPDGDAGEVYDIEVYPATGGAPTPGQAAVYVRTNQTTGLSAGSISHTPAVDLPGGALVARARVRTLGAWSAWSTYRSYTIVLTVPTITWNWPEYDGGWGRVRTNELQDPTRVLDNVAIRGINVNYAPPSGTTITTSNVKIEVDDPGVGGPAVGTILFNAGIGAAAGGGAYEYAFRPNVAPGLAGWLAGTLKATVTFTCANSATVTEVRRFRFAMGEWYGAVALGDSVSALASTEVPKGDDVAQFYRAQVSPTAANGAAPWRLRAALATVQGELPATNAYLGLWTRLSRLADDAELVADGSFESDPPLAAWGGPNANRSAVVPPSGGTQDGSRVLRIAGDGIASYPGASQTVPIIQGVTYRICGWVRKAAGTAPAYVRLDTYLDGSFQASVVTLNTQVSGWVYLEGYFTVPTDGSVDALRAIVYLGGGVPAATEVGYWDAVSLRGLGIGDAGMDRLSLDWSSLG
jgi:hypothetical protein